MALTPDQINKLAEAAADAQAKADMAASALQGLTQGTAAYEQALSQALRAQADSSQSALQYARETNSSAESVNALKGEVIASNAAYEQHAAALKAAAAAQQQYNETSKRAQKNTVDLAQKVGLMGDSWETSTYTLFTTKAGLDGIGKGFMEIIKPMNLAGSVVNAFVEGMVKLTTEFDGASVQLNRQTGMAERFEDQISASEQRLRSIGVSIDDVADSYGTLATQLGTFTDMSVADQSTMAEGIATLDKFGISADQTTGTLATMTAAMGMSGTEAVNMQKSLFLTAQENGISTGKMMADFAATSDELAALGDNAVDAFGDLAVAAEKSNMAVSDLLGITKQFDTFEGAARAVGSLNAVLGGPFLNSLEMVMATDPTERMRMLQGALLDSGKAFQDMSYYERKAIADAAGLQGVSDLAKVMEGNFDGLAGGIMKTEEELMALDEQSTSFNTLADELKQTMMAFAIELKPVVDFLKGMLQKFQDLDPQVKKVILGMAAAGVAAKLMGSFFSGSAQSAESAAIANQNTASSLGVYTSALAKAVAIGLVAIPVFYAIKAAASAIGKAFAGAGDVSAMFESLGAVQIGTFASAAIGIKQISSALNTLEDGKAIQISTVFDSAAAMTATQSINAAATPARTAAAGAATNGDSEAGTPIQLTTVVELDGREVGRAMDKYTLVGRSLAGMGI